MNSQCKNFRRRLGAALAGGLRGEDSTLESVRPLAWHEHLFGCHECRELLEAEEVLEQLLASLPTPAIPTELVERVLERLDCERVDANLDSLLAEADGVAIPSGLAARILGGLQGEREAASNTDDLDELLAKLPEPVAPAGLNAKVLGAVEAERTLQLDALLDMIPAPEVPAGLGQEILDAMDAERDLGTGAPILRPSFGALRYVGAIAATMVVAFGAWRLTTDAEPVQDPNTRRDNMVKVRSDQEQPGPSGDSNRVAPDRMDAVASVDTLPVNEIEVATEIALPDPSVLASLDVLEDWELLMSGDVDLLLGSLDEADAELLFLALEDTETPTEEG